MKWVAMKYIQTWIDSATLLPAEHLETLPLAIQSMSSPHTPTAPGERIPNAATNSRRPTTRCSINGTPSATPSWNWNWPSHSATDPLPIGSSNGVVGLQHLRICHQLVLRIPTTRNYGPCGDLIDDRLFKIRHCQDIRGDRQLPLFEPPINPACWCRPPPKDCRCPRCSPTSTARCQTTGSPTGSRRRSSYARSSEPRSRFPVAGEGDAEALAQLRATHEASINNLVMTVRTQQLDEATARRIAESRRAPVYRLQHQAQAHRRRPSQSATSRCRLYRAPRPGERQSTTAD